jgi:NAD(P)-dependent dehydrogenase (short-subunit alcohol dehydrogenase family)
MRAVVGAARKAGGGVAAVVRSVALDYAARGIRVNTVVPGATDTAMLVAGGIPAPAVLDRHADTTAASQHRLGFRAAPVCTCEIDSREA